MRPPDDERRPVSERVVAAVSGELDEHPTDLEPLHHAVDAEALDGLFPAGGGADSDEHRQFTFTYEDHVVTVAHDGSVELSRVGDEQTDPVSPAATGGPESPD